MSAGGEQLERVGPISVWRSKLRQRFVEGGVAHTLARGALWSMGINVVGYALALVVQVLLTHSLGRQEYGHYAYALGWMNAALLIGKLELDTAALRFVGTYYGAKNWSLLRGFLTRSHQLVWAASSVVAVVGAVVVWLVAGYDANRSPASLWTACALLPATAILQFKAGCLQGFKQIRESQGPTMLLRPLLFGAGVLLITYGSGAKLSAAGALGINLLAAFLAIVLIGKFLRAAVPAEARQAVPAFDTKNWVRTAAGLLIVASAQLVLGTQADVLVVGSMLGHTEAGQYLVASQLAALTSFGVTAMMVMALAMIADLHARGRTAELQRLVTVLSRASLVVSLPVVAILAIRGTTILGWFGPAFRVAYPVLVILSIGYFIAAAGGILAGFLLTLTGHQRQAAYLVVGSAILNLALSLVFTRIFGSTGTASATVATTFLRSAALAVYCWRLLGVRLGPFGTATSAANPA